MPIEDSDGTLQVVLTETEAMKILRSYHGDKLPRQSKITMQKMLRNLYLKMLLDVTPDG